MSDRWIVIPRWDEFQHRDMARSSVPPWIKFYTQLMSDEDFLKLTFRQRGILASIWIAYARARRQLGASPARLGRMFGDETVRQRDLDALNHAGFIEFSASKPARTDASLEVEVEKNPPSPLQNRQQNNEAKVVRKLILNGVIRDEIDLAAELRARALNGGFEHELRDLLADRRTP